MTKTRFNRMMAQRQREQQANAEFLKSLAPKPAEDLHHAASVISIATQFGISAVDAASFVQDMSEEK